MTVVAGSPAPGNWCACCMKRGKPPKRNKRLQRKKPLRGKGKGLKSTPLKKGGTPLRTNPERKAKRRERDFGDWRDRVVRMPCWWCGLVPRDGCAPAHAKTRATGHDRRALLPMCPSLPGRVGCHQLYDEHKLGDHPERWVQHEYVSHDNALAAAHSLYVHFHPGEDDEVCLACGAALDGPGADCDECGEASHVY